LESDYGQKVRDRIAEMEFDCRTIADIEGAIFFDHLIQHMNDNVDERSNPEPEPKQKMEPPKSNTRKIELYDEDGD
jgi:hypothetical protein